MDEPVINPGVLAVPVATFLSRFALVPHEPTEATLTLEPAGITAGKCTLALVPLGVTIAPGMFVDQTYPVAPGTAAILKL